jgi:D-beta-D-heptose 7-phosphate kinase/D-beta-D-heptose 1-phosphate adenosyltransferase
MLNIREVADCSRKFGECQILVIGDLMVDEYLWGHIERISPEAPVPILKIVRNEATLGGAGNVVRNLRALGVGVKVCGVVGKDATGVELRRLIDDLTVDTGGIICDPSRQSTRKVRLMSLEHGQQVFRMDEEGSQDVSGHTEDQLIARIEEAAPCAQAILCSDYMKGVLTKRVLSAVFSLARENGIVSVVGPKDSNAQKYRGSTILMPNQRELALLTQTVMDGNGWLTDSVHRLVENLDLEAVVVTRGGDGMSLFETTTQGIRRVDIPTMARSVYDVTGAGDTAISIFAASIAAKASVTSAVYLANIAAGIKVAKRGTNTVTIAEIHQHLSDWGNSSVGPVHSQTAVQ